jgi:hypothetical protein
MNMNPNGQSPPKASPRAPISIRPVTFLLLILLGVAGVAEEPLPWQAIRDQQPAGVQMSMTLPKTRFHIGEVITATLTFSHPETPPWHFSGPTGGRSGRVTDVGFRAESEDGAPVPDPLEWYFKNYAMMGGGGGTQTRLGEGKFSLAANQWFQFEKPGTYRLYAWSECFAPSERTQPGKKRSPSVALVSDPITITIEPLTADEERNIIADAVKVLDGPEQGGQTDPAFEAMQRLRFLQTPAARDTLLQYLDGRYDREAELAFFGRPDYAGSAAHILALASEGRLGLSERLANFYSRLKLGSDFGGWPGGNAPDPRQVAQDELFAAARHVIETQPKGAAFFADLLAWFQRDPLDPKIRALLVQRQLELPPQLIHEVFGDDIWMHNDKDLLVEKDFLPLIRELAKPERHNLKALQALARLAPDEARPIIIEDIRLDRPVYVPPPHVAAPNADFDAFTALPDHELPELDAVLRAKLPSEPVDGYRLEMTMRLIDRYATKALLPDVIRIYEKHEGHWQCRTQTAMLRYWIRCDPATGVEALGRALQRSGPGETGCYHRVLTEVLDPAWVDEALPLIVAATTNGDPAVVSSTTKLLEAHAGPGAIEQTLTAIERLNAQAPPADKSQSDPQRYLREGITRSLLESNRWTLSRPQLERLLKATTDPNRRQSIERKLSSLDHQPPGNNE